MSRVRTGYALLLVFLALVGQVRGHEPVDKTNAGLIKSIALAEEWLKNEKPTGDSYVLGVDYFQKKLSESRKVSYVDDLGMNHVDVQFDIGRDSNRVINAVLFSQSLLLSAESSNGNFVDWQKRKEDVLSSLTTKDEGVFDPDVAAFWRSFFSDWERDVTAALTMDSSRREDAFRQAAYSIVRVALDREKAHIQKVLTGASTPGGGGGSRSGLSSGGTSNSSSSASHVQVWHERMMNGIYRRHSRNSNKIQRITARR